MKILFASSEATPFAKTGGLADVVGTLPIEMNKMGQDARVILPLYRTIKEKYSDKLKYISNINVDIAWRKKYCGVFSYKYKNTIFYFIDDEFYFGGSEPYDYIHLDCEKFIFFSKAVLSLLPTLDFKPDIINCNDWQTGAIPVFLDTFLDNPFYRDIKTVMSIHNIKYQGRWDFNKIKDFMGISDYYFTEDKLEHYKDANLLKGGLVYANKIVTVSKTYAEEIKKEEYAEGLSGLINARQNDLHGILNGISYTEWNPKTDKYIYENYGITDAFEKKKINKIKLQKELNLPADENIFMIGVVLRMTEQKGFDLIKNGIYELVKGGIQIVFLGTGEEQYENFVRYIAWKYPDRVSANIYFNDDMAHKIYSASDAFLMPSLFEPCGLSQLISMRYGSLPIVRETGGLIDTVKAYNEYTKEGTGFSFSDFNTDSMLSVINYAMRTYYDRCDDWKMLMKNAMKEDFSWKKSCIEYLKMYSDMTGLNFEIPKPELKTTVTASPKRKTKK